MSVAEPDGPQRRSSLVRFVPWVVAAAAATVVVSLAYLAGQRSSDSGTSAPTADAATDTSTGPASSSFLVTTNGGGTELLADLAAAIPVIMTDVYGIPGVVATAGDGAVSVQLPIASKGAVLEDVMAQFENVGVRPTKGWLGIEDQDLLKSVPGAYVCTAESGTFPPPSVELYSPLCIKGRPVRAVNVGPEALDRPAFTTASAVQDATGWQVSVTLTPGPTGAEAWSALEARCAATVTTPNEPAEECPGGAVAILLGRFLLTQVDPLAGVGPEGTVALNLLDGGASADEASAKGYAAALRVAAYGAAFTVSPA